MFTPWSKSVSVGDAGFLQPEDTVPVDDPSSSSGSPLLSSGRWRNGVYWAPETTGVKTRGRQKTCNPIKVPCKNHRPHRCLEDWETKHIKSYRCCCNFDALTDYSIAVWHICTRACRRVCGAYTYVVCIYSDSVIKIFQYICLVSVHWTPCRHIYLSTSVCLPVCLSTLVVLYYRDCRFLRPMILHDIIASFMYVTTCNVIRGLFLNI